VLFTHMAHIDVLHVSYKGAGLLVSGLISGEAHVSIGPAPAWMVHVQAGRARALAMGGEKRSILWPDMPTIGESGLPGYVSDGWAGLMGPKDLPKALVAKLNATMLQAVKDSATNEALKKMGAEPRPTSPEQFSRLVAKDWKTFGQAIQIANLKVD